MDKFPDLDRYGVAETDEFIREKMRGLGELSAQVVLLREMVLKPNARVAQNSRNLSMPPPSVGHLFPAAEQEALGHAH